MAENGKDIKREKVKTDAYKTQLETGMKSLKAYEGKYRDTSLEYAKFSKAINFPQQRESGTIDGLGNIGPGTYKLPENKDNAIA